MGLFKKDSKEVKNAEKTVAQLQKELEDAMKTQQEIEAKKKAKEELEEEGEMDDDVSFDDDEEILNNPPKPSKDNESDPNPTEYLIQALDYYIKSKISEFVEEMDNATSD